MEFNGLTNVQLFNIAKINKIELNKVIMIDEIFKLPRFKNMNIIVNLDTTNGNGGSHWITLIKRNCCCFYYDSFGAICHKNIIKWCYVNGFKLGYSAYIVQSLESKKCGFYCLDCIHHIQGANSNNLFIKANEFVNKYEPLFEGKNEQIVLEQFKLKKE